MADSGDEAGEHPIQSRVRAIEFDGDTETVKRLSEEGQRTVDHQLDALHDIDAKAVSILKLNLVIVSAILAIGSFVTEANVVTIADLNNVYNAIGIVSLVLSAALAASTYTASDSEVGMGDDAIRSVIEADLTKEGFEIATAQSYAAWIEFNDRTSVLNTSLITLTTLLVVVAIVHLALGVYDAFVGTHTELVVGLAWIFLLTIAGGVGLPRQLSRAVNELSWEDLKSW